MKFNWLKRLRVGTGAGETVDPHFLSSELRALRVKLDIVGPTLAMMHERSKAARLVDKAAALLDQAADEAEREETAHRPQPQTEEAFARLAFFAVLNPIAAQTRDPTDKGAAEVRRMVRTLTKPAGKQREERA